MYKKSKEAQSVDRRRMFIKLKRFLFKSRCVTTGGLSHEKQVQRLENYAYKLPHLTESWEKSWRDTPHPAIEKSPLFHLSKAIGRVEMSPVELTKEYLLNPELRKNFSMLTVDKAELLKIQADVYANPQKYEAIFTAPDRTDWGSERFFWTQER
jgi:starvation-inducible outer membrane lipoprotein